MRKTTGPPLCFDNLRFRITCSVNQDRPGSRSINQFVCFILLSDLKGLEDWAMESWGLVELVGTVPRITPTQDRKTLISLWSLHWGKAHTSLRKLVCYKLVWLTPSAFASVRSNWCQKVGHQPVIIGEAGHIAEASKLSAWDIPNHSQSQRFIV